MITNNNSNNNNNNNNEEGKKEKMTSSIEINSRVETLDGHRGFARYCGEVSGQHGTWVGIEWDDQNRGKHDGRRDEKRYFECKRTKERRECDGNDDDDRERGGESRASFVRIQKLCDGVDFVEAAKAKYESDGELEKHLRFGDRYYSKKGNDDSYSNQSGVERKRIDCGGDDSVSAELMTKPSLTKALNELERILLPNQRVNKIVLPLVIREREECNDDDNDGAKVASSSTTSSSLEMLKSTFNLNAKHIDVSGNLLTKFSELAKIGECFKKLEILDASDAFYDEDEDGSKGEDISSALARDITNTAMQFQNLKTLALNRTRTSWKKALLIAEHAQNLEELRLDCNGLRDILKLTKEHAAIYFPNLKVLSLDGNRNLKWDNIWSLRFLPNLETLYASECSIEHIFYDDDKDKEEGRLFCFENLQGLFVGNNRIQSWQSVDALDRFPKLSRVRLSANPFCESDSASRHEIVARAGNLVSLNASEVTEKERRESEIRYLRNVVAEVSSTSSSSKLDEKELDAKFASLEVSAQHPRVMALKTLHGERALAGVQMTKSTQSQQELERLTLKDNENNSGLETHSSISLALTLSRKGKASKNRTFPKNVTVARVKTTCEKLFALKLGSSTLMIKDVRGENNDCDNKLIELEPDDDTLVYLGVQSGHEIFVLD